MATTTQRTEMENDNQTHTNTAEQFLALLCPTPAEHSQVDPGFSGGLRAWLEDGVAARVEPGHPFGAIVIEPPGEPLLKPQNKKIRQSDLIDRCIKLLFSLHLTGVSVRDPLVAIRQLVQMDPQISLARDFLSLTPSGRHELRRHLYPIFQNMVKDIPAVPATWMPRTATALSATFGSLSVLLGGRCDLVVGQNEKDARQVVLVDVRATNDDSVNESRRGFFALLETLRSGLMPKRVVTYVAGSGLLEVSEVSEAFVKNAVEELLARLETVAPW